MLATKNERSALESTYATLLDDILLGVCKFTGNNAQYPVNLHTLSSIFSELADFLKYFVHF